MYESKLYSMIIEKGENMQKLKDKCFCQINLNAFDKNTDIGEDTIVLYGLFIPKTNILSWNILIIIENYTIWKRRDILW